MDVERLEIQVIHRTDDSSWDFRRYDGRWNSRGVSSR